jgi:hypothetical protein
MPREKIHRTDSRIVSGNLDPQYISADALAEYSSLSRWVVNDLLRKGKLRGTKYGRRLLIDFPHAKAYLASLPTAKFTPSRK